ncbi:MULTISPECIES: polyprenyl synthetase family protein [unclassified Fusibacter]|uniref:polyprenyl synthetase family protein n=1 Tax=unclassified Fusibacter TaxID=2624464 RepID=UPI001012B6BB|nr:MULTISPECIES: polyprenyl synthetase family protein [unclassified Fusibacter]MCK8059693.1 polyprenyl synthetase family protein [Fusibacter sp. A2]NPE21494.1 polyprenyl synthetase family protein [Fusibacter sp. A1]RXV61905.1 polyprenyl synthetase family protein [Fusibacter sp. A1]
MANWFEDEKLESQLNIVKNKMQNDLKSGNAYLNESLDYLMMSGGKMLRPAFLLIGSRFGKSYKKKENELIKLATAIETLHIATLLHDDVIDEATLRRGQASIQSKYSKEYAIYMGDYLLSRCFLLLTELQVPKELAVRLARVVSKICLGEIRQHTNRYNLEVTPMDYIRIVSGKTAALFAIGLSAGGYMTKASEDVIKKLAHAGYELGMAFQMIDDLLDYSGSENEVGKDLRMDLLNGYYNMPVIFALKDESVYRDEIRDLLSQGLESHQVEHVLDLIRKAGAIDKTKSLALKYHRRAVSLIESLPDNEGRTILLKLVPKLLERIY